MSYDIRCGCGLAAAALNVFMLAAPCGAQEVVLDLSLPAQAKVTTLQVPTSGARLPLTLVKTGTKEATVRVAVTPFLSDDGERLVARLSTAANGADGETELPIRVSTDHQLSTTYLVVPPLMGLGPYNGSIFVSVNDGVPARHVVAITAANPSRPAVLQMAPETGTGRRTIRVPFWRSSYTRPEQFNPAAGPTFDIRFADAAGKWPVDVGIGPATVTKAPGSFSLAENAAFYDESDRRLIPPISVPREGRTIRLQLGGLTAGEYNATIPFFAANAGGEPRKFTAVVFVKHHVAWAVLCLIVALLLSYLASKLVSMRNERVRLVERVNDLQPFWLQNEPQTMAVVWIQSIVKQAKRLSQRRLLPSLDTIHKRLDTASSLLQTLDRLRRARVEIRQSALPRFATARALKIAERIGDRLDPEMGPSDLTDIANAIVDLRGWTRQGEWETRYSADLLRSINQLLADVDPEAIASEHRQPITDLVTELKNALPTSPADLEERERRYATLKIVWERRAANEFADLLQLRDSGIDRIFQKADDTAWARLKAQHDRVRFELQSHTNGVAPEAYDPLTFRLTAGDAALDATYLVMHGLTYEWSFTMHDKSKSTAVKPSTPSTRGPQVPYFAPFAGTLAPSVTLVHQGEPLHVRHDSILVSRSTRFSAFNSFSAGELLQLGLAFAVAAITGLQTFYYKTESFGSLADYMALFAWGATVDQVKNFLQRLPSAPSSTTTGSPATQVPVPATPVPQAGAPPAGGPAAGPPAPAVAQPGSPAPVPPGQTPAQPAAPAPVQTPGAGAPVIPDPPRPSTLDLETAKKP